MNTPSPQKKPRKRADEEPEELDEAEADGSEIVSTAKDRMQMLADKLVKEGRTRVKNAEKAAQKASKDLERFLTVLKVYAPGTFHTLSQLAPHMPDLDRTFLIRIAAVKKIREKDGI